MRLRLSRAGCNRRFGGQRDQDGLKRFEKNFNQGIDLGSSGA
ncbi:hypothetical protein TRP66_05730 [Pseudomonas sp. JDS28PS106]